MRDGKLALVQQDSPVGRKGDNLARTIDWRRQATAQGAELVCLPELGLTGHAGGCMVVDPTGAVVAESRSLDIAEEMIVVPLEAEAVARPRRGKCFNLQTRRPEVYAALTRGTE